MKREQYYMKREYALLYETRMDSRYIAQWQAHSICSITTQQHAYRANNIVFSLRNNIQNPLTKKSPFSFHIILFSFHVILTVIIIKIRHFTGNFVQSCKNFKRSVLLDCVACCIFKYVILKGDITNIHLTADPSKTFYVEKLILLVFFEKKVEKFYLLKKKFGR